MVYANQHACKVAKGQWLNFSEQEPEAAIGGVLQKGILKKFLNLKGKHLCWALFLIKLQVFRSATLLKRDSNTGVFL